MTPPIDVSRRGFTTNRVHATCVSWRGIFVGFATSILTFLTLMALGVGFGGFALSDLEGMTVFNWSSAIWTIAAGMISLFVGTYATSRISNFVSPMVGTIQGVTVSTLFFLGMAWAGGSMIGSAGNMLGGLAGAAVSPIGNPGAALQNLVQNEELMDVARNQLSDLGIEPIEVDDLAAGVVSRLINQDIQAAKNFIASETDLSAAQIERRINQVQNQFMRGLETAASKAASAFAAAGWYLFLMLVLTTGAGIGGGILGSRQNADNSIEMTERRSMPRAA